MVRPPGPITLVGLSGSLRRASVNTALLQAAIELAPADVDLVLHPLRELPFYDGDVETAGMPEAVRRLRAAVADADGLLLASPEYNHSTTAVLKNAIDWLSRGPESPLDRLPVALLSGAGGSGGAGAQAHLRDILAHNRVDLLEGGVQVRRARDHVVDGQLVSAVHREAVATHVAALVDRIRDRAAAAAAA
jgi:chromate reductase, NAD(P)H dehydrogenase (quinone)